MPKAKPIKPAIPDPSGVGYRIAGFTIIVIFAAFGLIWLWIQLPKQEPAPAPSVPVVQQPTSTPVIPEPIPEPIPKPNTPIRPRPVGMTCDATNSICVDASFAAQTLTSPFFVTGTAVAFEQQFSWRLEDNQGHKIEEGYTMTHAPDAGIPGPFEIRAFLLHEVPKTGVLVLFEPSAKDGTPLHTVRIPVQLPTTTMTVKVFKSAMSERDCSAVFPVEMTVPRSNLPVETTLRALLTDAPAIQVGTRLISLVVKNGTATAVFGQELEGYGGGSCNAQTIRSQIETTLKQFPSIKNVVISVEGKTPATTLQP